MRSLALSIVLALVPGLSFAQQTAPLPSTVTETYDAWTVNCVSVDAAGEPLERQLCEMSQQLQQQDSGQRVLNVVLQPDGDDANLVILTPFGLLLSGGVQIDVEEGQVAVLAFRTCLPAGCLARGTLTDEEVGLLRRGSIAQIQMTSADEDPFIVEISLAGFTNAWNRLQDS